MCAVTCPVPAPQRACPVRFKLALGGGQVQRSAAVVVRGARLDAAGDQPTDLVQVTLTRRPGQGDHGLAHRVAEREVPVRRLPLGQVHRVVEPGPGTAGQPLPGGGDQVEPVSDVLLRPDQRGGSAHMPMHGLGAVLIQGQAVADRL
jgi:hypothetical protein